MDRPPEEWIGSTNKMANPTKGSDFIQQTQIVERQRKEAIQRHRARLVEFFESDLLYKEFELPDIESAEHERRAAGWAFSGNRGPVPTSDYSEIAVPDGLRLSMNCPSKACKRAPRTLVSLETPQSAVAIPLGASGNVTFSCALCGENVAFLVHAKREGNVGSLVKAGQWPSLRPRPDEVLSRALGRNEDFFAKGMAAERLGFGIGAYAYYRRVAESITETLLSKLKTFADGTGNAPMAAAIDAVASEQQASKKINAVKDLLPPMLREGGLNPLGTIYGALSDHLHGRTDAECLGLAGDLRGALEFLLRTLEIQQIEKERYEASIRKVQTAQAERARKAKS